MRWIIYAVGLCVVATQMNAMPAVEEDKSATRTQEVAVRALDNDLDEEASEVKEVRVPVVPSNSENDLQAAASGGDSQEAESSQEEFSDDIDISQSQENSRSKRLGGMFGNLLSSFALGSSGGGDSSGGGSGNFLFDIIRRGAEGGAGAAELVSRLSAGSNPGSGGETTAVDGETSTTTTRTTSSTTTTTRTTRGNGTLVAGSGATEQQDEQSNSPLAPTDSDHTQHPPEDDGYQAGIPGPITRLFVIANRGIANLMQDLILRLAQTSERIVNFKARLITAII